MRALMIGPDEKTAIDKLVAFAMEPDHFFVPGNGIVPGDNPDYVTHVPDGFRCVFTFTKHKNKLFRHLTVSVTGSKLPSPEACIMLAREFGFTAGSDNFNLIERMEKDRWMVSQGAEGENCIAIVQPVETP
jgi:hypothetical protein